MIKIKKLILLLVLTFTLLIASIYATEFTDWLKVHNLDDCEYIQIGPGSFYKKIDIPEIPLSINIIEIELKNKYVNIDLQKPDDSLVGKGIVSNMVKDEIAKNKRVIAGINASFWESDKRPVGLFIDEGVMYNTNNYRSSLIKTKHGKFVISKTNLDISFKFKKEKVKIDNVNGKDEADKIVVYTSPFKNEITLKDNETGILVDIGNHKFTPTNKIKGKIVKFLEAGQKITPEKNTVVLIGNKDSLTFLKNAKLNNKVKFYIKNSIPLPFPPPLIGGGLWRGVKSLFKDDIEFAVTGAPQIVKNGQNIYQGIDEKLSESFINTKHPRTGCGITKNNKTLYWVVVDGRQPNFSIGVNLDEFAQLFLKLGSYNALNLDGGGSSSMVVGNQIMNAPSDYTGERVVSDAILLLSKARTYEPEKVKIMNYDNNFATGSKVKIFSALFDKTYSPIYNIVGDAYMRSSSSPTGGKETLSSSPTGEKKTLSSSPTGEKKTLSSSPTGEKKTLSPSPTGGKETLSSSLTGEKETLLSSPSRGEEMVGVKGLEAELELSCETQIGKSIDNNSIKFSSEQTTGKIQCSYPSYNLKDEKNIFVQDIDKLLIYPEELNLTVGKKQRIFASAFDKNGNRLQLMNEFINMTSSDNEILDFENNVIAVPKKEGEGIITIDTGKMVKVLKFNIKPEEKKEEK